MISVVIPLFNKAHTIVDTLATVMRQEYEDFEVVIVNDGSKDNGVDMIRQHFNDPRIRIINQENQGSAVARDRGVSEARSNYIAFLDADDKWHPEYLTIMNKAIEQHPNAALYSSGGLIQNADGSICYRLSKRHLNKIAVCDYFANPHVFGHTSSTIINKAAFLQTEGSPKGMLRSEDFALFFQIALKGDFVYVGLPISKYVGGISGQATTNSPENNAKGLKWFCFLWNFIKDKNKQANNKSLDEFIVYALRHGFKQYIKTKAYANLDYFLENLSKDCLSLFHKWELTLYKRRMNAAALIWINFTKVIWKASGKPVLFEKADLSKIDNKYLHW